MLHELYFGAYNGESSMLPRNLAVIKAIDWQVAEFSAADAHAAGMLRSLLRGRGRPIGSYDLLIAAQTMARGWTVVTNNMREFNRIDGLRCEGLDSGSSMNTTQSASSLTDHIAALPSGDHVIFAGWLGAIPVIARSDGSVSLGETQIDLAASPLKRRCQRKPDRLWLR